MKFCEIGVFHHDCWFTEAISRFPEVSIRELNSRTCNEKSKERVVRASWKVSSPEPEGIEKFARFVSSSEHVIEAKRVGFGSEKLLLVSWKSPLTSYDAVLNSGCAYNSSCYSKNGYETYSVFAENPNEIKKLLGEMEQIGEAKIFSIKNELNEDAGKFGLTPKQREALISAISAGYYSWPKKMNLEELAGKLGKKRRAVQENLRKAEGKVFLKILEELTGS